MSHPDLDSRLRAARDTLPSLVALDALQRNAVLESMAARLRGQAAHIEQANQRDLEAAEAAGRSAALIDRLRLDAPRIESLAQALEAIAILPDPLRDDSAPSLRADGLRIRRRPAPIGVIAMVYESRPNVTADAAALCFKAGNACVLRGGSEARHSNAAVAGALHLALAQHGIDPACVSVLDDPDRSMLHALLERDDLIDLVIPRGGEALIRHVVAHSRIPVIQHYKGVCHLFVDRDADPESAIRLLVDGKAMRPGVCNALECLLVDAGIAGDFLPRVGEAMKRHAVAVRACPRALPALPDASAAVEEDWGQEFLDRVLAVRVVDGLDAALAHIRQHGSHHTEVIATRDPDRAARFINEVDASAVMVNASSRFNDGGELGLGAEIGISTSKLHAYGPMGLESLTCRKWVVEGEGQVRHREAVIRDS
ncbi:glutamate-5-semialdehyde dehydrogenase [Pseudomarimonas salicorniae]|uniref:Gamma-glutamyl phosphate reductase n=1 Tax=Pseudomarimonas salicorniae TaxID=2933270 RepID=A0ABT0GJT5_9GAMM|nr:glutamate-5-semialdehyde dehydrogenase [Lysobacter sp. CAU 1642]